MGIAGGGHHFGGSGGIAVWADLQAPGGQIGRALGQGLRMGLNRPQGGRIRAPDAEQAMLNRQLGCRGDGEL